MDTLRFNLAAFRNAQKEFEAKFDETGLHAELQAAEEDFD